MRFIYKVKNLAGEIVKGEIEDTDINAATTNLKKNGFFIASIRKAETNSSLNFDFLTKKVPIKEKIIFVRELAIMIKSGLSIVEALISLKEETENKYFGQVIGAMIIDIQGGKSFSDAAAAFPSIFNGIFVSSIKSGEISGKIDLVLERLATQFENDYEVRRKVKGALSYPIFVMVALVAVMIVIMIVVIPQLQNIFNDAGVPLPALTRGVIAVSLFIKSYIVTILASTIAVAIGIFYWQKTPFGKLALDTFKIRIPVFGLLLKKSYMAQFTRTFASLSASGLPLLDIFESSGKVIGNVLYEKDVDVMIEKIRAGHTISKSFQESKYFPKMIAQMSMVGEKSGNISEVFDNLANFYDRDVDNITSNISTLLEPILMVVMGTGIGIIIISVLQPIYGLVNAI